MLDKVMQDVIRAKQSTVTFADRFKKDIIETQDYNLNAEISFLVRHHITPIQLDKLSIEAYKGW